MNTFKTDNGNNNNKRYKERISVEVDDEQAKILVKAI
jgi:hypothetical protein